MSLMVNSLCGFGAGGQLETLAYSVGSTGNENFASSAASYTSTVNAGTGALNRYIVAYVTWEGAVTLSSCSIDGTNGTIAVQRQNGSTPERNAAIVCRLVANEKTSLDIVATLSGSATACHIGFIVVYGLASATAAVTDSSANVGASNAAFTATTPSTDFIIGCSSLTADGGVTVLTEYDTTLVNANKTSAAYKFNAGAGTAFDIDWTGSLGHASVFAQYDKA